jgi:hypothetical protein
MVSMDLRSSFGTPMCFGNMSGQMGNFFDQTDGLSAKGALVKLPAFLPPPERVAG